MHHVLSKLLHVPRVELDQDPVLQSTLMLEPISLAPYGTCPGIDKGGTRCVVPLDRNVSPQSPCPAAARHSRDPVFSSLLDDDD